MSDTQKLTLSTLRRDLLRRDIYEGLADRAAGCFKDLDVDAILAKGKELLRKRSISNVRQFAVDGRKTLFWLLLLFAIPADDCSAQTPPPPVDEHAFERVPPTVVRRLATRFSLGAFAGRFEETPLGAVREAVGEGTINTRATLEVASIGCVIAARSIDYGSCPAERWAARTISSRRSLKSSPRKTPGPRPIAPSSRTGSRPSSSTASCI